MLNKLHASSHGVVAKILLTLVCLTFAVWGIEDVLISPDRNVALARVGGTSITTDQYQRALHGEVENIRRMMGDNYSPEAMKNMNVEGYVLQNLINRRLLQLESANLGLIPGDIDVVRRIRGNPSFQDNRGNFDKGIFESMLRNINTTEKIYVDQLREDMAINILLDTLASGVPQPDFAAPTLFHAREEGRQVTLYALQPSAVTDIPAPDDEAVKTYYEDHQESFTAPEWREGAYITITPAGLPKDAAADEAVLRAAYNERINEYKRPERRDMQQLLYSSEAQAKKAYDMIKGGKSVADTASALEPLNKGAISMGKVERENVFESAADTVFSLKTGETAPPVQSPFGWHVFHVSAIEPPAVASFEEVRPALEKEIQQRLADEALTGLANKVEDALAGGASLSEAAQEFGLKLTPVGPVTADGLMPDGKEAALPELDKFLETLFKTEEKTESPVMSSHGGIYYILRTETVRPEHLRPLEEVRQQAVQGWKQQETAHRLDELAQKLGAQFAGPGSKAELIAGYKLQNLGKSVIKRSSHMARDIPLPPALVSDIFTRGLNEGTEAHPASGGTYLLAVAESTVPVGSPDKDPKLAASLAEIKRSLQALTQNEVIDEYTQYLRGKYAVTVHDDVFRAVTD